MLYGPVHLFVVRLDCHVRVCAWLVIETGHRQPCLQSRRLSFRKSAATLERGGGGGEEGEGWLPHELLRKQTHEQTQQQQEEQGGIEVRRWQRDRKTGVRSPREGTRQMFCCETE